MSIILRKPVWLNKKVNLSLCKETKEILRNLSLHTVCEESFCPNISECFSKKTVTFMILGNICTRMCSFCKVSKGSPKKVKHDQAKKIKEAIRKLGIKYVVITSPTRDDILDGGASIFCQTVKEIKSLNRNISIEILIPDFLGKETSIKKISFCGAEVIAHNLETVPSLYIKVRKGANYSRSLNVLEGIKRNNSNILTKSSIMLGLGEKDKEIAKVLGDLRKVACDFLTLGQYLCPSHKHYPVKAYIEPAKFKYWQEYAKSLGFKGVTSGPYARSSYLAYSLLLEQIRN